jgi:hypothetical protein
VEGAVEACGGLAPGHCHPVRVAWVALLDARGRLVSKQFPAAGHLIDGRFSLPSQVPGRFVVQTRVDGVLWKREVTVVGDTIAHTNIVIPIQVDVTGSVPGVPLSQIDRVRQRARWRVVAFMVALPESYTDAREQRLTTRGALNAVLNYATDFITRGDIEVLSTISGGAIGHDGQSADPAVWADWLAAWRAVGTSDQSAGTEEPPVDVPHGYRGLLVFLSATASQSLRLR